MRVIEELQEGGCWDLYFENPSILNKSKVTKYSLCRVDNAYYIISNITHPYLGYRICINVICSIGVRSTINGINVEHNNILSFGFNVTGNYSNGYSFNFGELLMLKEREITTEEVAKLEKYLGATIAQSNHNITELPLPNNKKEVIN